MMRLILASASPRRAQLLTEAGYAFEVAPADVDEAELSKGLSGTDLPLRLAIAKADVARDRVVGDAVVLAADTVALAQDSIVLGKPENADDARRMMRLISGTVHRVSTGYSMVRTADGQRRDGVVTSLVRMRPLSEAEVETFIASGEWEGKAGGYGIQDDPGRKIGEGDPFVESIAGELTNIVGLPMPQIVEALASLGIDREIPAKSGGLT